MRSDLHLPVRPGCDLPVALAIIAHWERQGALDGTFLDEHTVDREVLLERASEWTFERAGEIAGVATEDIRALADVYAASTPAVIRCGWGLERNRNGGQAVAAVLAMPALLGKFGVHGGGYTMSNSGTYRLRASELVDLEDWDSRVLDMTQLGRVLGPDLDPPVKALFVYNANPAVTVPDQSAVWAGLAREDLFTVVSDQVMTDTARFADIVLPAATFPGIHRFADGIRQLCGGGDPSGDRACRRGGEQHAALRPARAGVRLRGRGVPLERRGDPRPSERGA